MAELKFRCVSESVTMISAKDAIMSENQLDHFTEITSHQLLQTTNSLEALLVLITPELHLPNLFH